MSEQATLDRIDALVCDAITTLSHMRLDCTRPLREDEVSEVEGRRVTALGYLEQVRAESAALIEVPRVYRSDGGESRGE